MGAWLKTWKGGLTAATVSLAVGLVRAFSDGGTNDWLTWACFLLGALYLFAAVAERRWGSSERPEVRLGRHDAASWWDASTQDYRSRFRRLAVGTTQVKNVRHSVGHAEGGEFELLKNRIGNALATLAAIVGLVLVFTGAGQKGDDDDAPATPPSSGQVAPAIPGQSQPAAPAQSRPPAPGQTQAPAPAQPKKDNDGDDDDG